jgi:dCTP deaminase
MILSNRDIIDGINKGLFNISPLAGIDPSQAPFNTSAVDLRLDDQLQILKEAPAAIDLRTHKIAPFLTDNSVSVKITEKQPYALERWNFVLGRTIEIVDFTLPAGNFCYSARVEGRSSLARCASLFTSPPQRFMQGGKAELRLKLLI